MKPCWAQYTLWATILVLGVFTLLGGCGAKGDLYHPATKPPVTSAPAPAATPAPAAPSSDPEQPK